MQIRAVILTFFVVFAGFVLEHLPMPDLLSWLQPLWLLLLISILVLHAPHQFGLWLAIPLGLMLDVENHQLLGLNVLTLGVHIVLLQLLYRRLIMFHFLQLTAVMMLLVVVHQVLQFWAVALVSENRVPVAIWEPALVSGLVWPWLYALLHVGMKRLHLA